MTNKLVYVPGRKVSDDDYNIDYENTPGQAKRPLMVSGAKGLPPKTANSLTAYGAEPAESDVFIAPEFDEPEEQPLTPQEQLILREQIIREYDALRQTYISEGEKSREDAKQWSQRLIETTENDIRKIYAQSEQECKAARKDADEQGYSMGYDRGLKEGTEKGYKEGFDKGLAQNTAALKELTSNMEYIDSQRERFFKEHESQLFDIIFTIANKITVDSLKQKDKAVITKMLKEAAKGFRNSEYVKVTLSKLDVSELVQTGADVLREAFRDNQHVEFEYVKDAPPGTLILDNGSEITDASVATQLMMIEKLGKGKFRDKTEDAE